MLELNCFCYLVLFKGLIFRQVIVELLCKLSCYYYVVAIVIIVVIVIIIVM